MWQQSQLLFLLSLVLSSGFDLVASNDWERPTSSDDDEEEDECSLLGALPYVVAGGVGLIYAGPVMLSALGFQTTGIAAGSLASSLMSWSATISGGGVPAGGLVATLQSIGATASSMFWGSAGGTTGVAAQRIFCVKKQKSKKP
ncbi:interferon alpha-inducible protein 6 [Carettochelys insculpta]|uniref:interferon alpha-inducible protein 6 n=1 Tax=Carettochelys insculpta TaxID=44489 RepID=UPI003EB79C5E